MSSTLFQEWRVMLAELLLSEKDETRVWLRAEMDRLVDPVLDTLFNRLNNKLANGLERTQSGGGADYHEKEIIQGDQLEPSHNQVDQAEILNVQPSTSFHLIPQHVQNVHHSHQQPNDNPIHCNDNFNQQSEMSYLAQPTIPPNAEGNFGVLSNEQSNQNFDDEDEGECYCDECVNGIEIGDEVKDDDDDSDSVQCIDDEQGEQELPTKRARIDLIQPNDVQLEVAEVSHRQPTEDAQPNEGIDHDKRIITVHLRCLDSECPDTFAENELNDHMMVEHSIGPNRCLVKECKQSFNYPHILGQHIKRVHRGTSQWHCDKCPKHYPTFNLLSIHNYHYHQLGLFQCAFPTCPFTGEYKMKVYTHYHRQHKPDSVCQQSGCNFRTKELARFKAHERAHLGIKPFRCKWLNCNYSHASRNTTIKHITKIHFNPKSSSSVVAPGKASDYLEVIHSLL